MVGKSDIDLSGMTAEQLTALIQAAEAKRAEKLEQAKTTFVTEMRERAAALGLSLDQLLGASGGGKGASSGRKRRSDAGTPATIRYRGPQGETWSGRGRPPGWLVALENTGRRRNEFKAA